MFYIEKPNGRPKMKFLNKVLYTEISPANLAQISSQLTNPEEKILYWERQNAAFGKIYRIHIQRTLNGL